MKKVQTGLRIPEKKYDELQTMAEEMGVSLNSLLLMLVDLGLMLKTGGFTLEKK